MINHPVYYNKDTEDYYHLINKYDVITLLPIMYICFIDKYNKDILKTLRYINSGNKILHYIPKIIKSEQFYDISIKFIQ